MARRNGGFIGTDGLDAPDPPTGVTSTAGDASVSVAFTAPTDAGTSAITGFVAQVSINDTAYSAGSNTGTSSPIVVSSLTNGTAATAKVWAINAFGTSAPSDASASFTPIVPPIALFGAGHSTAENYTTAIDKVDIASLGNGADFGNLSVGRSSDPGAFASSTRGIWAGGNTGSFSDVIDYVTIASAGNATDFGNLSAARSQMAGLSNSTRGVVSGGDNDGGRVNIIEYVTIANTGNATDFGNLSIVSFTGAGFASPTRGVMTLGYDEDGANASSNVIEYITIGSTGNSTDFGDLTAARYNVAGFASATRGVVGGGQGAATTIDYVTIASTGNATDFGDPVENARNQGAASSKTRGLFAGGFLSAQRNVIQYITIASTGNAQDFGDLSISVFRNAGLSNSHGGLA